MQLICYFEGLRNKQEVYIAKKNKLFLKQEADRHLISFNKTSYFHGLQQTAAN